MSVLICGSVAYDTIMVFHDRFKNHLLPEQLHILNISFLVPDMRRDFGGCAGNIAYTLKLLGGEPLIMATVGQDAGPYRERLARFGIPDTHLREIPNTFTAQCFITTDLDDNQITAFHPGAMSFSTHNKVADAAGVKLGIVGPDSRDGMVEHAREMHAAGIPFVFDPGQGLPLFDGPTLLQCLEWATWCTVNDYEAQLIADKTELELEQIAAYVEALIVTRGSTGSDVYTSGRVLRVPAVKPAQIVDPTGCGDAYRGGLLYGLSQGWPIEKACRLGSLMGAIKIAVRGPQNHTLKPTELAAAYTAAFGESL
ncbi:MAG: carbohydrate kinase family protein [Betaproteobacteria bacterium]|nr:carbohydrate kinase family protein [Betaproteobacteria bacterium]